MSVLPTFDLTVPVWTALSSREEFGAPYLPMLTVVSASGVGLRDLTGGRSPSEDLSGYRVVNRGDLVVNKLWARFGAYGVSPHEGIISPAYWVLQVDRALYEPRFVHHLLRSDVYKAEISRVSRNLPPNGYDLSWEQFRGIPLPVLALEDQRRIADFLDDQVAQLDRAIALRQRQVELLTERHAAHVEETLRPLGSSNPEVPARHLVRQVAVGIVIQPAALYVDGDDGVPAVRGTDISPGQISKDDLVRISPEGHLLNARSQLQTGDVLVVRTGQAGAAAQVPEDLVGGNCIDLVIVRPGPSLDPRYLEHSINSHRAQEAIVEHSTGAIQRHFGVQDMKALPIVQRGPAEQKVLADALDIAAKDYRSSVNLVRRGTLLLHERKQALITAAVTGEFDVTTARGAV